MKYIYYKQIVQLLSLKPEGLKVSAIAIHIYNQRGSLFSEECLYDRIYESVRQYLWQQSHKKHPPFVAVEGKRGYYRLNDRLYAHIQKEFSFDTKEESTTIAQEPSQPQAEQLSLFD